MKNTLAKLMIIFETTNKFTKNFKKKLLKSIFNLKSRYISVKIEVGFAFQGAFHLNSLRPNLKKCGYEKI